MPTRSVAVHRQALEVEEVTEAALQEPLSPTGVTGVTATAGNVAPRSVERRMAISRCDVGSNGYRSQPHGRRFRRRLDLRAMEEALAVTGSSITSGVLQVWPPSVERTYSMTVRPSSRRGPWPSNPLKSKSVYETCRTSSAGDDVGPGSAANHGLSRRWLASCRMFGVPKVVPSVEVGHRDAAEREGVARADVQDRRGVVEVVLGGAADDRVTEQVPEGQVGRDGVGE